MLKVQWKILADIETAANFGKQPLMNSFAQVFGMHTEPIQFPSTYDAPSPDERE